MTTPASSTKHALVLGGSISGLLSAAVLAKHFERVTIIERDDLATEATPRKAVPQGAHAHAVLARGLAIMEQILPGLTADFERGGATLVESKDVRIHMAGWRKSYDSGMRLVSLTRPFLEWTMLGRVRALPNVTIEEHAEAIGLIGDKTRVTGVKVQTASDTRDIAADFIVDARGRASNLADWFKALGVGATPHETSPLGSLYSSAQFEAAPGESRPDVYQVACMERRIGVLIFPVERNRVLVSIGANTEIPMPKTHAEMLALLATLPVQDTHDIVKALRPLTEPALARFTASVRRKFDELKAPPEGIVAIGDAVASFNPVFGQGMTIAALEAEWLNSCISARDPASTGFARAYFAGVKPIVDYAWGWPDLEVRRANPKAQSWPIRFVLWYTNRMVSTATRSTVVSKRLAEVQNMVRPPASLFTPPMFFRILFA